MWRHLKWAAALVLGCCTSAAFAQPFPSKPVEIIVPFSPGGSTDLGARIFAAALQAKWSQPVRVINMPGGNAAPAIDVLMRATPDGHTVMFDGMSSSSLVQLVVPNLPYKITDRTFLTLAMKGPMFLAVKADSPYQSLADVVKQAKSSPDAISWVSVGGVGTLDLAMRKLFKAAGVDVNQTRPVVFKGGSDGAVQVVAGNVTLGAGSYGTYASFIDAKKARLLAVFSDERSRLSPDIPSTREQGLSNASAIQWNGFSGPPNVSQQVTKVWNDSVHEVLKQPEVVTALARIGAEPDPREGSVMRAFVEDELVTLTELFGRK